MIVRQNGTRDGGGGASSSGIFGLNRQIASIISEKRSH